MRSRFFFPVKHFNIYLLIPIIMSKKINPAIKMLNNMIVGWSAIKMTSLLRYLSWFSSAMQTMKIGNSNNNIRLVIANRSVFSFRRSLQAQIFARNAEIILCSDSITEQFPFQ